MSVLDVTLSSTYKHSGVVLSNNNLTASSPSDNYRGVRATHGRSSGKWYWEVKINISGTNQTTSLGVASESTPITTEITTTDGFTGTKFIHRNTLGNNTWMTDDVIGFLLNLDVAGGTLQIFKNGEYLTELTNILSIGTTIYPMTAGWSGYTHTFNFGASPFTYSLPKEYTSFEGKQIPLNNKILILSNNKTYSLKSKIIKHETNMTSNTTPSPLVASTSSANSSYPAWKAFDNIFNPTLDNSWMSSTGVTNAWVQIDYSTPRKVNAVVLKNRFLANANAVTTPYTSPKDFDILGSNDGVNFILLKSERNLPKWENGEIKNFTLNAVANFRYYRVHILNGNNDSGNALYNAVALSEIEFLYFEALTELPVGGLDNFIQYGTDDGKYFGLVHGVKKYVLQDGVSQDTDGLWKKNLDRKPLSIKFEKIRKN